MLQKQVHGKFKHSHVHRLMVSYLRAGAVSEPWVGFEGDHLWVYYVFKFFCCHGTELHGDHEVRLTMALQDRDVLVAT